MPRPREASALSGNCGGEGRIPPCHDFMYGLRRFTYELRTNTWLDRRGISEGCGYCPKSSLPCSWCAHRPGAAAASRATRQDRNWRT